MSKTYWAADSTTICVNECVTRTGDYYRYLQDHGWLYIWRNSYSAYNSAMRHGSTLRNSGDQGQVTVMHVNDYRNLIKHRMTMTISQDPVWQCQAENSDPKSLAQCEIGSGLVDYYMREEKIGIRIKKAVEFALQFGEGVIELTWNATKGKVTVLDPDTQTEIHEGNVDCRTYEPVDVIRDVSVEVTEQNHWYIVRSMHNKWDLAVKYPEWADKIQGMNITYDVTKHYRYWYRDQSQKDTVHVFKFYHKKTDACPNGREIVYLDNHVILSDGPLGYKDIPLHIVKSGDMEGTTLGYSDAFDLLILQEYLNGLYTSVATNQSNYSVPKICVKKGENFNVSTIADTATLLEYEEAKPEVLNMLQTPPEIFNFINKIEQKLETLSGINSVVRGNPQDNIESGSFAALMQSLSVQFSQDLQQNYVNLMRELGTSLIDILKDYATTKRVAAIVGKAKRSMLVDFNNSDLEFVNRVQVDIGSAVSKTVQGKLTIAQTLGQLCPGLLEPDELIEVMNTGNLDVFTQGKSQILLNIQRENEKLRDGEPVQAIIYDDHPLHVKQHLSILSDPDLRMGLDQQKMKNCLTHIQEHFDLWRSADPSELAALGITPLPPQAGAGAAPGGPPAPPQAGGMQNGMGNPAAPPMPSGSPVGGVRTPPAPQPVAQNPNAQAAQMAGPAQKLSQRMPTNPTNRQRIEPPGANQ